MRRGSASGLPVVVAVADGHGSPTAFRSDVGARRALWWATTECLRLVQEAPPYGGATFVKDEAQHRLPQVITRRWRKAVLRHRRYHPFTEAELARLEELRGAGARKAVLADPALVYGSTLLVVAVAESYALFLQLGDGDILVVSQAGEVTRPIPKDPRLLGNETTSLCAKNAWKDFQVQFSAMNGGGTALVTLSTDGYSNSFRDEASFCRVGPDLLERLRQNGVDRTRRQMSGWLEESSSRGSGDDTTLAILYRGAGADGVVPFSIREPSSN